MSKIFKRILITIGIVTAAITFPTNIFAAEKVIFTKQPIGGSTDVNTDFAITWATNSNSCQYMLQMREGANYEWGNVDYVTSPHKENYSFEFKSDYRIMAMCDDSEYYSNSITVSWVNPSNMTTADMNKIEIGDLPLGYNNAKTYPISITNTGKYEIISPKLEFGEGYDYCEIIQNKTPHNIKPGETDNTTWSIKPKKGLGIGRYDTYVYLKSKNVEAGTASAITFWVIESDVAITYEASANAIDFGTLAKGYSQQTDRSLIIKSTGTGNLSHVHIVRGETKTTFFDVQTNYPTIDTLSAGTDSGKNWTIKLRNGLEPGTYSEQIKIFADELKNPVLVTIKVKINDNTSSNSETTKAQTSPVTPNTATPAQTSPQENTPQQEDIKNESNTTGNTNTQENDITQPAETKDIKDNKNYTTIIIIIIATIATTAGTLLFFKMKNKNNK